MNQTMSCMLQVSEWYSCRWDCPAVYELVVKLIHRNGDLMDVFKFKDILEGEKQNQWLKVNIYRMIVLHKIYIQDLQCIFSYMLHCPQISHVFENYGIGLREIIFEHSGKDRSYWAGHYGSKMAGACICVKIPDVPVSERMKV